MQIDSTGANILQWYARRYITFAEFSKEVRQYGVNADDSFVKEVFNSIGSSGTVRKINKSISYKQLLARLRHWQAELYGEKVTCYKIKSFQLTSGTDLLPEGVPSEG